MTYTEEFKYKCPVDWTPVTHTITFEKEDQVRVFEDTVLSFSCSRNAACAKCAENYRD